MNQRILLLGAVAAMLLALGEASWAQDTSQAASSAIVDALNKLGTASSAAPILLALSVAATASTAIIQLIKDLTAVRRWFQESWLDRWFTARITALSLDPPDPARFPTFNLGDLKRQIVELATGGDSNAFFDLPSDQLVAQLNAAAQSALDYPGVKFYYPVVAVLSQGVESADVEMVAQYDSAREAIDPKVPNLAFTDARTRIGNRMQRNLDGMQISLGNRWQFILQTAAFVASTAVIELAVLHYESGTDTSEALILAVPIGFFASYLSPVVNDLIKGLQSLRKP